MLNRQSMTTTPRHELTLLTMKTIITTRVEWNGERVRFCLCEFI